MSIEENKSIVRRYQEIYNSNNLDALNEVVTEDFLTPRMMPGMPSGLEGAKQIHQATLIGMPDWHTEIEELITEGDKVVARITITGTHTGDFFGFPATGKKVKFSGIYIARIASRSAMLDLRKCSNSNYPNSRSNISGCARGSVSSPCTA